MQRRIKSLYQPADRACCAPSPALPPRSMYCTHNRSLLGKK
jgi:hypothetical protein